MKKYLPLLLFIILIGHFNLKAQQTVCDSMAIDSVYIDNNMLYISVYNSSQHFIAYPFFTFNIDSNAYIQFNDNVNVLSFLSVPGDGNNGFNTASYSGNIAAPNTVPLNTNFTGNLIITDPNDSSFNCVFPVSFNYGTLPTQVQNLNQNNYQIYPVPAYNSLSIVCENISISKAFQIIDACGRIVKNGVLTSKITLDDLSDIDAGTYFIKIISENSFTSKITIAK
jgi:hypothetical protein